MLCEIPPGSPGLASEHLRRREVMPTSDDQVAGVRPIFKPGANRIEHFASIRIHPGLFKVFLVGVVHAGNVKFVGKSLFMTSHLLRIVLQYDLKTAL